MGLVLPTAQVKTMKLLVTGGYGFIGSNFIRYMLEKYPDAQIINVDNLSYGSNFKNLSGVNTERYKFVKGDIADYTLIQRLVEDVDAIVNFAAETHVDRSIADPHLFFRSNVDGVLSILEAVRKARKSVRIIQISTDEVYGEILDGSFKESDRLNPSSPYSATKAAADMICLAYHRTFNLDIVIARPTNNFGPYQFPEKLIPKTIIRVKLGQKVPIYGTGKNVRDWLYVMDTCEAIDLLLKGGGSGEIYNISAGNEFENIEVVKMILAIMGKSDNLIEFVEDRPGHDVRYSIDATKIKREMGWKPKHSFHESLRRTVEWYVNNEWWWRPIISGKILHSTPWKLK